MNILAVRFARLGDVILLLPALAKLKAGFPNSRITFLTGHRCAPVAELCPAIDDIISVDRIAMREASPVNALLAMTRLARDVRRRKFDLVIDFHGFRETNLLAWFSGAPQRLGLKRFDQSSFPFCFNLPPVLEDKTIHVSEMFSQIVERVGSAPSAVPTLVIPEEARRWERKHAAEGPRLALFVDAPVPERIWPAERFAGVADHMIARFGAKVVVLGGPDGAMLVERVRGQSKHPGEIQAFAGLSISRSAAVIEGARLLVSNDTGPMHFGPALGVPTLGLFSVGLPEHFRPTGPHDQVLLGNPIDKVDEVEVTAVAGKMWTSAAGRDPQR